MTPMMRPAIRRMAKRRRIIIETTDGLPHNQALGVKAVLDAMTPEYRGGLLKQMEKDGTFTLFKPSGSKEIEPTIVCRVDVDGVIHPLSDEWVPKSWFESHKS